jgi:hypothetical protein
MVRLLDYMWNRFTKSLYLLRQKLEDAGLILTDSNRSLRIMKNKTETNLSLKTPKHYQDG